MFESGRQCGDGLGLAGGLLALKIGDHLGPDRGGHLSESFLQRGRAATAGQLIDDAQVEQHGLGIADR